MHWPNVFSRKTAVTPDSNRFEFDRCTNFSPIVLSLETCQITSIFRVPKDPDSDTDQGQRTRLKDVYDSAVLIVVT